MYTVSAAFSTFDVENGPSCSYDCVEVMNVDTLGSILRCVTLSNHSGVKATKNKYLFCNENIFHCIYYLKKKEEIVAMQHGQIAFRILSRRVNRFCGMALPQLTSDPKTKFIIVSFHSDVSYTRKGFQLMFNTSGKRKNLFVSKQNTSF